MAILNRFSAILLFCDSTHFCFSLQNFWQFQAGDSGNCAVRDSRFYAANRVFLNLWFGKPMVCVRVAFHENDGNHENYENDEDNSDRYKQELECWIRGNHGNHENS